MLRLSLLVQLTDKVSGPVRRIRTSFKDLSRDGKVDVAKLSAAVDKLSSKLNFVGDRMVGLGKKLSVGVSLPLAAFGIGAFNAASDAAELQAAFDQTFGKMAPAMNRWAVQTGDAMGRATQEMQKAANTFGLFFNQAAPPTKAAKMSATFARLAQDLGSFFNVDTDTAIEKLRSGLAGETEPLRDFGVFMSEAAIKAKAMQLGLGGVGRELTEQERIVARYAVILDSTKKAQGDVARTSQGTANQIRRAKAAYEELQVTVGTRLLPQLTPLIEKLASMIEKFNGFPRPVKDFAIALAVVGLVAGPMLSGLGGIVKLTALLLPRLVTLIPVVWGFAAGLAGVSIAGAPLWAIVAVIAAIAAGAIYAWKNWASITKGFSKTWADLKAVFKQGAADLWNSLPGWLQKIFTGVGFLIKFNPISLAANAIKNLVGGNNGRPSPSATSKPAPRSLSFGPPLRGSGNSLLPHAKSLDGKVAVDVRIKTDKGVTAKVDRLSSNDRRVPMSIRGSAAAA